MPKPKIKAKLKHKPKARAPEQQQQQTDNVKAKPKLKTKLKLKAKLKPRSCNNEYTLMGDETKDIPKIKLYISPSGNCFNISEDLVPYIKGGNNADPYTGQPFWTDQKGMIKFLNHPGLTKSERSELMEFLYSPLRPDVIEILSQSPSFRAIYDLGYTCYSDQTQDFKIALDAIKKFNNILEQDSNGQIIYELRERRANNPQSVREMIENAGSVCIHGVGINLMRLYLDLWHIIPEDKRPELPCSVFEDKDPNVTSHVQKYAKLVSLKLTDGGLYVFLYIYDWKNIGQMSHYWYIFEITRKVTHHKLNGTTVPKQSYMYGIYDQIIHKYINKPAKFFKIKKPV